MQISRRHFVSMTGAVAAVCSFRPLPLAALDPAPPAESDIALLDLGSHCALPESLEGYQAALAGKHTQIPPADLTLVRRWRMTIVPGVGRMDAALASALSDSLQEGTNLLLESGAAFLNWPEFACQQKVLRQFFDIGIQPPVDLWSAKRVDNICRRRRVAQRVCKSVDHREFTPYVRYLWPRETLVRDFSRAIPVSAAAGKAIGKVEGLPVAWKTRIGNGTLIFLGSPMGPALRAGDLDAHAWLRLVTGSDGALETPVNLKSDPAST